MENYGKQKKHHWNEDSRKYHDRRGSECINGRRKREYFFDAFLCKEAKSQTPISPSLCITRTIYTDIINGSL